MSPFRLLQFSMLLFVLTPNALWANPTSVTNEGNIKLRIQYKMPDAPYQDLYLEPGQTRFVPGGVQKVKLSRDYGEWPRPPKPEQKMEVKVRQNQEDVGRLMWFGDQVLFETLTEPSLNQSEMEKKQLKVQDERPASREIPISSNVPRHWPWFYGMPFTYWLGAMTLLAFPLILGFIWSFFHPRLHGFGASPFGGVPWQHVLIAFYVGFFLAAWGIAGCRLFPDREGFLIFFAHDLYWFPIYLMINLLGLLGADPDAMMMLPHSVWVLIFWILISGIFGSFIGRWHAPTLYSLPVLIAFFPLMVLARGCRGPNAYAWEQAYEPVPLYPGAFSSLFLLSLIFLLLLNFARPYGGYERRMVGGEEVLRRRRFSGLMGCFFPFLGIGVGILVPFFGLWGYWEFMEDSPVWYPFFALIARIPLMFNIPLMPPTALIYLFWFLFSLMLGIGVSRFRFQTFYMFSLASSFLILILLVSSYPPGVDLLGARNQGVAHGGREGGVSVSSGWGNEFYFGGR